MASRWVTPHGIISPQYKDAVVSILVLLSPPSRPAHNIHSSFVTYRDISSMFYVRRHERNVLVIGDLDLQTRNFNYAFWKAPKAEYK